MTREEMLAALQADVNAWPQRVKEAGVTNSAGSAYVPQARNNEILRSPNDPEATCAYMIREWGSDKDQIGSDGWFRIIRQVGHMLTWEWLIADDSKPYAALFPDSMRQRVLTALEADANYDFWVKRQEEAAEAERARAERIAQVREEMRTGKRPRPNLPELDSGL
jgi:hypothetical protein